MATATSSKTRFFGPPSPADKAEMIRRHFPALLPTVNPKTGELEAPSLTEAGKRYVIEVHDYPDGVRSFRCNCRATVLCTHEWLAFDLDLSSVPFLKVHRHIDRAALEAKYAHVLQPEPPMRRRRAS